MKELTRQAQALAALEREVRQLRRDLRHVPAAFGKDGGESIMHLVIIEGNTLDDGSTLGIKYVDAGVADVPSAYDPDVDTTFIDGIGRAKLWVDGVEQAGHVLVVNDGRGSIDYALFVNDRVFTTGPVQVPIAGTLPVEYVAAYPASFL